MHGVKIVQEWLHIHNDKMHGNNVVSCILTKHTYSYSVPYPINRTSQSVAVNEGSLARKRSPGCAHAQFSRRSRFHLPSVYLPPDTDATKS